MQIQSPQPEHTIQLRALFQTAFGDSDAFLDRFFSLAFAPERCRCVFVGKTVAAALYLLPAVCAGQQLAYLYAVATAPPFRGHGLCRALIADAKDFLRRAGYCGALLVPESEALARMYEKMGFSRCTAVREFICDAGPAPAPVHRIDAEDYARLRRALLMTGGVIQEGPTLRLLASDAKLYTGPDFIAAVQGDFCCELLGNEAAAPGLACALNLPRLHVRTPGRETPFAMLCKLTDDCPTPTYFGLALD